MLKLYDSKEINFEHNGLGILIDASKSKVIEEQNGMFELEFTYKVGSFLYDKLKHDMIVKADASPNLMNQLFRIYYVSKEHSGHVEVKAQHISYDLLDNFVESVNLNNVTCEYALNYMFKSCTEKNEFKGYSDIMNSQNYSIECVNAFEAIKGTRGSIVDTFGLGAKIKRDNFDIHVLNVRGESNNVLIAYKKNIRGLNASVDTQDVVTKIYPYAIVDEESEDNSGNNQVRITLPEKYIESKNIEKYAKQKITPVDFSGEDIKTVDQLRSKAKNYFNNKKDLPLANYKVDFIELSKTENYKDYKILEDVNLDDEVIVRDFRLDINATTRVVKTEYDPVNKKYISIELGQLVNHWKDANDRFDKIEEDLGNVKDEINNIDPGVDDNKFPDLLPDIPNIKAKGLFATIQLQWTYENKMYYNYEIYASQIRDFTPDINNYTNRIYQGKASAFLHEVKPAQTWYYKARAGNTHGNYTEFSTEVEATTRKISDASEYMEEACIDKALIGSLDADKINAGKVSGTYIDAKNLVVTDGNGNKTLDIDSFGNVRMNVTELEVNSGPLEQVIQMSGVNLIPNTGLKESIEGWDKFGDNCEIEYFVFSAGNNRPVPPKPNPPEPTPEPPEPNPPEVAPDPIPTKGVVVYFVPHQYDEVLTLGGSIMNHALSGHEVKVVLCTDGRGSIVKNTLNDGGTCTKNNAGIEDRHNIVLDDSGFIAARDREFIASCKALGVLEKNIIIPKNRVVNRPTVSDMNAKVKEFENVIKDYIKPEWKIKAITPFGGANQQKEHTALGIAVYNICSQKGVKDLRYYINPYILKEYTGQGGSYYNESFELNSVGGNKIKSALTKYGIWNTKEFFYSIGYHSVYEYFKASEKGQYLNGKIASFWHKPVNPNQPEPIPPDPVKDITKMYLYDVDDGTCFLIKEKDKVTLIDTAEVGYLSKKGVITHMKNLGIKKIDNIVITHFHSDHAGDFKLIADNFDIGNVYAKTPDWTKMPAIEVDWKTKQIYDNVVSALSKKGKKIIEVKTENYKVNISDNSYLTIFNGSNNNYYDYNNTSLAVRYTKGDKKIFIAGDIKTKDSEQKLAGKIGKCDFMIIAHHAYQGSNGQQIISEIEPKCYFIPTYNSKDSRHSEVIGRLKNMTPHVYSTDINKTIVFDLEDGVLTHSAKVKC